MSDNQKSRIDMDRAKEVYDNIKIPDNIDDFIIRGIKKGKKNKVSNIMKIWSSVAAVLIIALFITSVRVSPVFASYVSNIPGLGYVVRVINGDKGLQLAVEHGLLQEVEAWDEHEGVKLAIEKVIADNSRLVLFYAIQNNSAYDKLYLREMDFKDDNGEMINVSFISYGGNSPEEDKISRGKIDISLGEHATIPETINMYAKMYTMLEYSDDSKNYNDREKILESTWNLKFNVDMEKHNYEKLVYPLNQVIEVDGQRVEFVEVVVHPLRTELVVRSHPDNSKKIFGFDDLRLVDGNGNEYGPLTNNITATYIDENTKKLYMESSYFSGSDKLYIKGSSIRALNREDLTVVVDLKERKILTRPDDRIELEDISFRSVDEELEIIFNLQKDANPELNRIFHSTFNKAKYGATETYAEIASSHLEDIWKIYVRIKLEKELAEVDRLELEISDYPARITKDFSIKVK